MKKTELATFAGGCFWCMVAPFAELPGVIKVVSGYTGGHKENPPYEEVASKTTGHHEAVQIGKTSKIFSNSLMSFRVSVATITCHAIFKPNSKPLKSRTPKSTITGIRWFISWISWMLEPWPVMASRSAMYILLAPALFRDNAISTGFGDVANMLSSGLYSSLFPDFPVTANEPIKSKTGMTSIILGSLYHDEFTCLGVLVDCA